MEFLENPTDEEEEEDGDDDEDDASFTTAPLPPVFPPVAAETLPMRYDHTHREEQLVAVSMGGGATWEKFDSSLQDYYTLRLRGKHTPAAQVFCWTIHDVTHSPVFSSDRRAADRHALPPSLLLFFTS